MWIKAEKLFFYLLLAYFTVSFTLFAYRFVNLMSYPYDIVAGEGMVFSEAVKIAGGEQIYKDINSRPYYISNYPPVYQAVCAAIMKLTGKKTLFIGRFVSALSTAGVAFLIYLIVFRLARSKLAGVFGVLSFCSFWYIFDYAPYFRVDMLGLFLGLLGLFWIHLYSDKPKVYLAVIFFVLSVFTKQSYIFAPISGIIYLFIVQRKKAFIFTAILAALILFFGAMGNFLTQGQFQKHIFMSFQGSFSFSRAFDWFWNFIRTYFAYIILAGYAVYRQIRAKEMNPYLFYIFLALIPMIAVGRVGGYSNYYFEICVNAAIFTGIALGLILSLKNHKTKTIIFFLLCLQMNNLTAIDFKGEYLMFSRKPGWTLMPTQENVAKRNRIAKVIEECGGMAISETSDINLLNKNTPAKEYHSFLKYYIPEWNPAEFLNDLRGGRYNCVITEEKYDNSYTDKNGNSFEKEKHDIIFKVFHLKESIGNINVYERNKKQL